ncbi:hypothetical protein FH972_003128 [Carpinus fangiana]|uniref:Uncharacterized protein n=1 Tax=Carpinus fangiana TaxID=176857 RepID=A0A5N6QHG6_9ROSI|nr:hypothetical protein FH972_003128 [Carpinus fangiana]
MAEKNSKGKVSIELPPRKWIHNSNLMKRKGKKRKVDTKKIKGLKPFAIKNDKHVSHFDLVGSHRSINLLNLSSLSRWNLHSIQLEPSGRS